MDGVEIEAPLEGTLILIKNDDQPGVIGEVGTILGRFGVNIASFALGRDQSGAVGVITVDESAGLAEAVKDLRSLPAVKEAVAVNL